MTSFDRSYGVAAAVFTAGLLVLILLVQDFGDSPTNLPRFEPVATTIALGPTNSRLADLFTPAALAASALATNLPPPFATTFFQPPPPKPAPAKKTRKVTLTYNGFFETSSGEKRAYVMVGGALAMLPPGAPVVSDLMISNIQRAELTLMRAGTQAVTVPFRGSQEVEIPAE